MDELPSSDYDPPDTGGSPTDPTANINDLWNLVKHCTEAMEILHEADRMVVDCGCFHSLGCLENAVLNAAASPDCVGALLYMAVLKVSDKYVVRYLEAGSQVKGFTRSAGKLFLKDLVKSEVPLEVLPCFTDDDVDRRQMERDSSRRKRSAAQGLEATSKKKKRSRIGERWTRLKDGETPNAASLNRCISNVREDIEKCHHIEKLFIVARRIGYNGSDAHRFQTVHGFEDNVAVLQQLQASVDSFATHGVVSDPINIKKLCDCHDSPTTLSDQFELLGCLSNYHWGSRPRDKKSGLTADVSHLPVVCHYSFTPLRTDTPDCTATGHLPNSPRNLIVYYLCSANAKEVKAFINFRHLLTPIIPYIPSSDEVDMTNTLPPSKRRRTQKLPNSSSNLPEACTSNMAGCVEPHLFTSYVQHMTSNEALLYWVVHEKCHDLFVMNDMDAQTGLVKPFSLVYVHRHEFDTQIRYSCSCQIYQHTKSKALSSAIASETPGIFAHSTCAHCRFLNCHIEDSISDVIQGNEITTKIGCILKTSSQYMNKKVILVGSFTTQTVAKFSVIPGGSIPAAFVHISKQGFIYCKSGECAATSGVMRYIKNLASLRKCRSLCPHLACIAENPETAIEIAERRQAGTGDSNEDDDIFETLDLSHKLFNVNSGKWEIPAFSHHQPSHEGPQLSKSVAERLRLVALDPVWEDGYIIGPTLTPAVPISCECRAGFNTVEHPPDDDGFKIIYTRNAVLKCKSQMLTCTSGNCIVRYTGKEDNMFFLSSMSGVGDEIGWDFVARITTSKCSFSSFCSDMSRIYLSNNVSSHPFLSRNTFLRWWFAWIAAQDIDFRKNVDPLCAETRRVLACDGTHVGVSLTSLHVTGVETPTQPNVVKVSNHRRYDRVLLHYRNAISKHEQEEIRRSRSYLRRISCEVLGKEVPDDLPAAEKDQLSAIILRVCPQDFGCKTMIESFLDHHILPNNIRSALAKVFFILSGDAVVSAFMPFRCHEHSLSTCDAFVDGITPISMQFKEEMYDYCPELANLINSCEGTAFLPQVLHFIRYLVSFVREVHEHDLPSDPPEFIPGTYDPESGVAYYFTDHGCRVRDMPRYDMNMRRHNADIYDDAPEHDVCNKKKAFSGAGGFNYTFFWFCPIHGHCLGFHLMPGAEGRRDPFSSLYAYLPKAPDELFYDFACSLNEYCMNREPEYFQNTRFWHDLFHGFSHKCPPSLRSSRLPSLDVLDTEICEQFNSFLQNIKYTGSHLSQSHFCLYLQFMIYIWNCRKDERWQNINNVAIAIDEIDGNEQV